MNMVFEFRFHYYSKVFFKINVFYQMTMHGVLLSRVWLSYVKTHCILMCWKEDSTYSDEWELVISLDIFASANSLHILVTSSGMSFINNMNNVGPSTEPCGMQLFTAPHFDCTPPNTNLCLLLWRNDFIQCNTFPVIQNTSILTADRSCGTVSNDLANSM